MTEGISILILAAGASTRMQESIKQLLPWKNTTLLGNAIEQAQKITDSIVVILGSNAEKIKKVVPKTVKTLENPNWEQGMGSSISCGAKHVLEIHQDTSGVLLMLADQPLIDVEFLNTIISAFKERKKRIVATDYGEKLGVPAIFDHTLLTELSELKKDFGARHLIMKHESEAFGVVPDGKEIDVDTKKEYNQLIDLQNT